MTIPKEAIGLAARAVFNEIDEWYPLEGVPNLADHAKTLATAALTAAAPTIQAAALREAAELADDPSPDEMDYYQIDQAQAGNWLRARADQLEGKTE